VAGTIFFTDNYADRSTNDGYQFEFYCRRCGNGYSSSFQHSGRRVDARRGPRVHPRQGARPGRRRDATVLPPVPPLRAVGVLDDAGFRPDLPALAGQVPHDARWANRLDGLLGADA
jgi:hypothetical protein